MEHWRAVTGYEDFYEVSNQGRVRSSSHHVLKLTLSKGYLRIELAKNAKARKHPVHRLVLAAFVGPCPEGKQGNHKNGVKTDNHLENLEYVTRSENALHAYRVLHRPRQQGSLHGRHKLIESEVLEIIRRSTTGETLRSIATDFNVCDSTVSQIARGRTWRHLPRPPQEDRRLNYGQAGSNIPNPVERFY
jgi:hypothetical protein